MFIFMTAILQESFSIAIFVYSMILTHSSENSHKYILLIQNLNVNKTGGYLAPIYQSYFFP